MSWERNQKDPFWATALGRMTAAGQRITRGIDALIRRSPALSRLLWVGSGWRTGSTEHSSGRAIDIIAWATGQRARTQNPQAWEAMNRLVFDVLVPNAKLIGIRHIIWDRRIYRTRYGQWGALPNRTEKSSIADWHEDHAHVWLDSDGSGWADVLDRITIGTGSTLKPAPAPAPTPGLPSTGASGPTLKRGSRGDAVTKLQAGLRKVFPAYRRAVGVGRGNLLTVDGIYGAATEAWVMEFQARVGIVVDGIVGATTRAHLAKHGIELTGTATAAPTPKPAGPTKYRVVTKVLPLVGRSGPGKQYRQTMRAHKGAVLDIVEVRGGWAKSTGGHWYSIRYLRRV